MKIGNNPPNITEISDNLLERMQDAHQEAKASTSPHSCATKIDLECLPDIEAVPTESGEQAQIEAKLLMVAQSLLTDDYSMTPTEVRESVVEIIVDQKFGDMLDAVERRRVADTLKEALVDDPGFSAEVDDMLILAARKLGMEHTAN
ncbi:MAG: hypothetical protein H0U74_01595 [Bradymonadaceae bacterium]|nr:hypothetical protein [Lujinxingiaceae bacterium]